MCERASVPAGGNFQTGCSIGESGPHCSKWKRPVTEEPVLRLCVVVYTWNLSTWEVEGEKSRKFGVSPSYITNYELEASLRTLSHKQNKTKKEVNCFVSQPQP